MAREGKAAAGAEDEGADPMLQTEAKEEEEEEEEKKKKTRRFTRQQIACCIAAGEPELQIEDDLPPFMESLSEGFLAKILQDIRDTLDKMDADREPRKARRTALQEELRKERQDILDQYLAKGYAEYEVDTDAEDDDEEEEEEAAAAAAARVPRPGRRRFRQGVVKRSGRTKRLN